MAIHRERPGAQRFSLAEFVLELPCPHADGVRFRPDGRGRFAPCVPGALCTLTAAGRPWGCVFSSGQYHDACAASPARPVLSVAATAQGAFIIDRDGKRYIDASSGAAVSCLGHGHPDVLAAMRRQLASLATMPIPASSPARRPRRWRRI